MYVCICQGVTDRQIREVVELGACSLQDVQSKLPVGMCCGSCENTAQQIVDEHLAERMPQRAA
jgi:bacterioferritin-associated ferredoxin